MKTKYKYLEFVEGLENEWTVWNHQRDDYLGVIKYNKGWKEYEFLPEPNTNYTVVCLIDLADFIRQINTK